MPALLLEYLRCQPRKEHRIQIDVDQVVEILDVLARDRIAGLVWKRHGVEKRVERTLHQLDERLLDRIFARAAQHRVFENMSDAGGIRRRGYETDAKYLVFVAIGEREQLGTGLYLPVITRHGVDFSQVLLAKELKTVARGRLGRGHQGLQKQTGVQSVRCWET